MTHFTEIITLVAMQCIDLMEIYGETLESGIIEYLSKTFEGLSTERKDYVLNTARSLLEIQDNGIRPIFAKGNLKNE